MLFYSSKEVKIGIDTFHKYLTPIYNEGMYSRRCLQMENIKHKSKDVEKNEFTPKETNCSSESKEYKIFIDTIVSVVEKYGNEILREIDCAV